MSCLFLSDIWDIDVFDFPLSVGLPTPGGNSLKEEEICPDTCIYPHCNHNDQCYQWAETSGEDCQLSNMTSEETFYYKYGK